MNRHIHLYSILGITNTLCSQEAIRAAYKKRVKETHPDIACGKENEFLEVVYAYKILSNEVSRKLYDESGKVEVDDVQGLALEQLYVAFKSMVTLSTTDSLLKEDILGALRKHFFNEIKMLRQSIREDQIELDKLKQVSARIQCSLEINHFKIAVSEKMQSLVDKISVNELRIKALIRAGELVDHYYYTTLLQTA